MQLHLDFSASYERCMYYQTLLTRGEGTLASKHRLCNTKTDYESNYTAPKQTVIVTSH
jgi:hypothetical protein